MGIPKASAGLSAHWFMAVVSWSHEIACGVATGHSIWAVSRAEADCENKQALVQLWCSSCIFNLALLHPGLNFPLFWDVFFFLFLGPFSSAPRLVVRMPLTFTMGRNKGTASFKMPFRSKTRKNGQMASCLPKHSPSSTRAGPQLGLSSPVILLFMNGCKRLRGKFCEAEKPKL